MKSRTLWFAMSSLALLAVVAIIGSVKFYAQEQKTDVKPRALRIAGGKDKQIPAGFENIDPRTLELMRRQEALEPAIKLLYEEPMKSPDTGFTSIAFEGDGLAFRWKGPLNNDMLLAISKAREIGNCAKDQPGF